MAMDFKQLLTMREEIGSLSSKRHKESDVSYLQGLSLLEKAHAQQYKDKSLLLRASDAFMDAIQHNRRNPDPYVGVAYLFLLLGKTPKAIRYLNEARRVAPSHEKARILLDSILEQQDIQKEDAQFAEEFPENTPPTEMAFAANKLPELDRNKDYDLLYDQIETLLMEQSKKLMNEPIEANPSMNISELGNVRERGAQLNQIYGHIDRQLKILDEEIDTSELRIRLRPLEVMKRRLDQILTVSQQYQEIQARSQDAQSQCQKLYRQILSCQTASEQRQIEAAIEPLLDECDKIADALDSIAEQGFDISPVEDYYQQLIGAVETCQDLLDERGESAI
jgi:tetratricopeptide (TPR) repeat protein